VGEKKQGCEGLTKGFFGKGLLVLSGGMGEREKSVVSIFGTTHGIFLHMLCFFRDQGFKIGKTYPFSPRLGSLELRVETKKVGGKKEFFFLRILWVLFS